MTISYKIIATQEDQILTRLKNSVRYLKSHPQIIDGIIIPPGYVLINKYEMSFFDDKIKSMIRWYKHDIPFIFFENDPDYLSILNDYREQTKLLQNEIHNEFKRRNLPFFGKKIRISSQSSLKKDYKIISVLIRPPLMTSNLVKTEYNRMNQRSQEIIFCIHMDQQHNMQDVRLFLGKNLLFDETESIAAWISKHRREISLHFGDWKWFACNFALKVEEVFIS